MNRIERSLLFILLVLPASFASGCLHSRLDESWGKSYEAQVVWQTANPDAPTDYEPTEGLDPETAARVAERYYEGQEKQQQRRMESVVIGELP